jgi:hypothetical protein
MIIELTDNTGQLYYLNTAHVIYIRQRANYGLWKIVLVNDEHILTDSTISVKQIINSLASEKKAQELLGA